jgi:hypothetical protein
MADFQRFTEGLATHTRSPAHKKTISEDIKYTLARKVLIISTQQGELAMNQKHIMALTDEEVAHVCNITTPKTQSANTFTMRLGPAKTADIYLPVY